MSTNLVLENYITNGSTSGWALILFRFSTNDRKLSKAPVDVSAMQLAPAECGETKLPIPN
jgi:hypothetical protein